MTTKKVRVFNDWRQDIWFKIEENEEHTTHHRELIERSISVGGGVTYGEVGVQANVDTSNTGETEASSEWSGFIQTDWTLVGPGKWIDHSLEGDESTYFFFSYGEENGKRYWFTKGLRRSEDSIRIRQDKTIDSPNFHEGEKITAGDRVKFVRKGGRSAIGVPKRTASGEWDYASFSAAGGFHSFFGAKNSPVRAGESVRIQSESNDLLDPNYKFMYYSQDGWVYYDKNSNDQSQFWVVEKVRGARQSRGDDISYGDEVKIYNVKWNNYYLTVNNAETAITCKSGDDTRWILTKE